MSEGLKKGDEVVFEDLGRKYTVKEDEAHDAILLEGYDTYFKASNFHKVEGVKGCSEY